jgi:exodeoxyribonuclease VII small subunit
MTKKTISYRKAMEELESIVKKIEQNEPDVDELNDLVTRAVELVKYCKTRLKTTEEKLKENLEELD